MSIFKQLIGVAVAIGAALGIWAAMAPASFRAALEQAAAHVPGAGPSETVAQAQTGGDSRRGRRGGAGGPSQVIIAPVTDTVSNAVVQALGTGVAVKSITLFAQSGGPVREVLFRAGDRVKEGQTLVRLDDEEQKIAVDQVKIKLETARSQVERFERLAKTQAVTAVQLDEARNAVRALENELAAAELALSRKSVRAPFDGVAGLPQISVGDIITASTVIATLDDRSTLLVRFTAPERFAAQLSLGDELTATTAAFGDERFTGEIESIDSRIDPAARTLTVRARVPNDHDRLRPGMSFAVRIDIGGENRLTVPALAVQWDRQGAFVWKLDGARVRRVDVSVLARTPDSVQVEGKLKSSDRVVTEGVQSLRDGAEVQAAEAPENSRSRT